MTNREREQKTRDLLRNAGIEEWKNDAWLLFSAACGFSRTDFLLKGAAPFPDALEERLSGMEARRVSREPLQYILGEQDFYGRPFHVRKGVLIPRQDTEILVEEALRQLKPGSRILDLCTGSGCILISLLCEGQAVTGIGTDISEDALALARENASLNHVEAEFIQSDLFEQVSGTFNLIVSNPPYIPSTKIDTLMPEVRDYEPHLALDGDEDGLSFYRRIAQEGRHYLKEDGRCFLEIGNTQADPVSELLRCSGWKNIRVYQDLSGHDRVVSAEKR